MHAHSRVGEEAGVEGLLGQGVVGGVVGAGHHVQGAGGGQLVVGCVLECGVFESLRVYLG